MQATVLCGQTQKTREAAVTARSPKISGTIHTHSTNSTPSHTHTALLVFSLVCFPLAQVDSKTRHEALSSEETLAQSVCWEDCFPSFSLGGTVAVLLPSTTSGCGRTLNRERCPQQADKGRFFQTALHRQGRRHTKSIQSCGVTILQGTSCRPKQGRGLGGRQEHKRSSSAALCEDRHG